MKNVLILWGLLVLSGPVIGHNIIIDQHEIPLEIDTYARYRQNQEMFIWSPFDSTRQIWDLTRYPGGLVAKVGLRDYTEGRYPAPDTMENDPPAPAVCEFDTLGDGTESEAYLYLNQYGLYADGIDFFLQGYRFLGNYRPDGAFYSLPMQYGSSWNTVWSWQYEIIPGIPYQATEQHEKRVVAKGKVKVPMSGDYFWPCLVIKDYMVYTDNMGTNDRRWIYEWVVPGHFAGGNGVAGAVSENGAPPDFMTVKTLMQIESCSIPGWDLRPPVFTNTRVLQDTIFTGPFVVWSTISDNNAVGAESLFYRINLGQWVSAGPDSQTGATYYFTIPSVTPPARIDYYIWAKDSFSVENDIEFWTTWPVCSPESTMITFYVRPIGTEEESHQVSCKADFSIFPNPSRGQPVTINLVHPYLPTAMFYLYGADGRLVKTVHLVREKTGRLAAVLEPSTLSAGVYFYRCHGEAVSYSGKLTLLY